MRVFTIASLLIASVLTGCSEDKTVEERLSAAANIFAGHSYNSGGGSFAIEDFDTKTDVQRKTMSFVEKRTGSSFSVSETRECEFKFRWHIEPESRNSVLSGNSSIVDFSKLNLKSAKFFNSKITGYGILEIGGIDDAIIHVTTLGISSERKLNLSGIPVGEKELYLNRIKTMAEKFCKGRS